MILSEFTSPQSSCMFGIETGLRGIMKMKRALASKRHEAFVLAYMTTMNGTQAALAAGYASKNPKNAHIISWYLLRRQDVRDRLAELQARTTDDKVITLIERKVILSDMIREGDRPLECIELMNKIEGVYRQKKVVAATGEPPVVGVTIGKARSKASRAAIAAVIVEGVAEGASPMKDEATGPSRDAKQASIMIG